MPTPVGHAIAGLTVGWCSQAISNKKSTLKADGLISGLVVACVAAAVAPDIDILFGSHRTFTHSVGAAAIVGVATWLLRKRGTAPHPFFWAVAVTIAYGTHILLDWLAKDTAPPFGLMALWPFSRRFYLSNANAFLEVSRRYWKPKEFILGNFKAVGWEILALAPFAALAWGLHRRSAIGERPSSIDGNR